MKYMFSGCKSVLSLDLKSFNTKKLKEIKYMFNGCNKLINLEIEDNFVILEYMI